MRGFKIIIFGIIAVSLGVRIKILNVFGFTVI